MATKDLITQARAQDSLGGSSNNTSNLTLSADETNTLTRLITAVSDAIEKYCRRRFVSTAYDELYNGNGDRRLLLRQYPIQSVQSVRYRPVTVMQVKNTLPATNQQARVSVTSTGLKLVRVASGVKTTDTSITWATYPTLNAVVNGIINTLGGGWTAQIVGDAAQQQGQQGDYGLWPSADLYCPNSYGDPLEGAGVQESQGALDARNVWAELKMHTYELQGYQWDARGWLLRAIPYTDPELMHPEDLVWPVGINNFRIQYTAGYTTVPEAVQEACAKWVAELWWRTKRDPALVMSAPNSGTAQAWNRQESALFGPPAHIAALLAPYRRHTVATDQG